MVVEHQRRAQARPAAAVLALACVLHAYRPCEGRLVRSAIPCDFPERPQFPERPVCPPTTLTPEDARRLAWRFAPEFRFHPLEDSFLIDPVEWFEDAAIVAPESLLQGASGTTCSGDTCMTPATSWPDLLDSPEWSQSSNTNFQAESYVTALQNPDISLERKRRLIEGSPFTAAGRSTADMTYSFFTQQEGNAWVFNFHPFYAWNGCSNQAFSLPLFGSLKDIAEYYACPIGAHEFDLEFVGVYVCPADLESGGATALAPSRSAIRRVQYSQHAWVDEFNCDEGECPFEDSALSESKLVAYSGLFSHAMYPKASSLWVYGTGGIDDAEIPDFIVDGINAVFSALGRELVFIADRTAGSATTGKRWVPTEQNLRALPPLADIEPDSMDAWAAYPGSWGVDMVSNDMMDFSLTCVSGLNSEAGGHTRQGRCSRRSAAYRAGKAVLGARDATSTFSGSAAIDLAQASTARQSRTSGRTGPLFRRYTNDWQRERPAPIYTQAEEPDLECPGA